MAKGLTVGQLIRHLEKYPKHLMVSVYRPPFHTVYRVAAPSSLSAKKENHWLYNTRRVFIPTFESTRHRLPESYRVPDIKARRRKKDD